MGYTQKVACGQGGMYSEIGVWMGSCTQKETETGMWIGGCTQNLACGWGLGGGCVRQVAWAGGGGGYLITLCTFSTLQIAAGLPALHFAFSDPSVLQFVRTGGNHVLLQTFIAAEVAIRTHEPRGHRDRFPIAGHPKATDLCVLLALPGARWGKEGMGCRLYSGGPAFWIFCHQKVCEGVRVGRGGSNGANGGPEGVHVARKARVATAADDLRRDVPERAGLVRVRAGDARAEVDAQVKVAEHRHAVLPHEHVLRFDVIVHDSVVVEVDDCGQHLQRDNAFALQACAL